ncbi:hypothetical protein F5I97DRAFT_1172009 [Phlebopus sp. FC_14]|nr:hypothetical protein F5I97DRAFT_1172009 [Phlebopus sp. FC_14]
MESNIKDFLGSSPTANNIAKYLTRLAELTTASNSLVPEVKSYPDVVYFNYHKLGLSLQFSPRNGYKPARGLRREELRDEGLVLDGIDIYNIPEGRATKPGGTSSRSAEVAFSTHPRSPLVIPVETVSSGRSVIHVAANTTGKELVGWLGEPSRKGGGAGPSSGSIGIWCEWSKAGMMIEFGGEEARGAQAWERGKDAVWKVITIFAPQTDAVDG